jgi:nanoRNase/pAp phosphatase (c-di-AMP/oligoRNAs hydrolase)
MASGSTISNPSSRRPRSSLRKLLRTLADKKRILVTTHMHPDPDALASAAAMAHLLRSTIKDVVVDVSINGPVPGGINSAFSRIAPVELVPWDDAGLGRYDAIVLTDVQPQFPYSPLPTEIVPTIVVDHHRSRGRRSAATLSDIRKDVGACTSILYSYLLEGDIHIDSKLAAMMLYAIESDLAGAAAHPDELDNIAISGLTLLADPRLLYSMRHAPLPREYYIAFARGVNEATRAEQMMTTFLGDITSPEMPAVVADFLLRLEGVEWVLVSATYNGRMIVSLRTNGTKLSAGELMRKLLRGYGEGGGHKAKAGGFVPLKTATPTEADRIRKTLRRRLLRALGLPKDLRCQKLVADNGG